jgi:hypothetical protein
MEKKEERKQEKAFRKRTYEKPRIAYQQSLEIMAVVCDKGAECELTGGTNLT